MTRSVQRKSVETDLINFLNNFHSTCINSQKLVKKLQMKVLNESFYKKLKLLFHSSIIITYPNFNYYFLIFSIY
jgi:hypothetical protein